MRKSLLVRKLSTILPCVSVAIEHRTYDSSSFISRVIICLVSSYSSMHNCACCIKLWGMPLPSKLMGSMGSVGLVKMAQNGWQTDCRFKLMALCVVAH